MTEAAAAAAAYIGNVMDASGFVEFITAEYFKSNWRVFAVIDYYQGKVYEAYTDVDYNVVEDQLASLMGLSWTSRSGKPFSLEGLDLRNAYSLIADHLKLFEFPTLPESPKRAPLYDDIFEVALLRSQGLLTNLSIGKIVGPDTGPFAVDRTDPMQIGAAIHDGWALQDHRRSGSACDW
jgi:hypothetical protein